MKILHKYKSKDLTVDMFEIPIYDARVCLIKYENSKAYQRALQYLKRIGVQEEDYEKPEYENAFGFTDKQKTKIGIVHFVFMNVCSEYKPSYVNTLSHENYHLVHNICSHNGLEFRNDSHNEHIAYLTGYLFEALLKIK